MSESDETVRSEVREGVATLTLNRPEVLNAITAPMLQRLGSALEAVASDDEVKVVVLTGAGRAFSAGVDLKALGDRQLTGGSVGDFLDEPARQVTELLTTIPKVVIARINGACFTGALELALACDLIVVAEDAKLGDTHAKWGLRPTWGMSVRLWRAVGVQRARMLSYTAQVFSGREAAAWGLAHLAVSAAELDSTVGDLARAIAANSSGSLAAYKHLYRESTDLNLSDGLNLEASTAFEIDDTEARIASFR